MGETRDADISSTIAARVAPVIPLTGALKQKTLLSGSLQNLRLLSIVMLRGMLNCHVLSTFCYSLECQTHQVDVQ